LNPFCTLLEFVFYTYDFKYAGIFPVNKAILEADDCITLETLGESAFYYALELKFLNYFNKRFLL
jgi:hypothetical protein